ncbi:winged helix-turn-helix domain-containing protein [Paraburkholderia sp. BR13439]|uniref:response regulator transcription factor n=1 Tax=Paraburkholderia TaxID=1822464 RepID=UPI0034CDB463
MKVAVLARSTRTYQTVEQSLARDGLVCHRFTDDLQLVRELRRDGFDLLILDGDSVELSSHPVFFWRDCHSDHRVPIIALASFADIGGLSKAFEAGADDVVSLPAQHHELAVRARNAIRRSTRRNNRFERLVVAGYTLDKRAGEVTRDGQPIRLTTREFAIAWLFFSKPGDFFSRKQLAASVWGSSAEIANRTLEQHIYKLRKKLSLTEASPVQLRTVYSLGYKLEMRDLQLGADMPIDTASLTHAAVSNALPADVAIPAATLANVIQFDRQRTRIGAALMHDEALTG